MKQASLVIEFVHTVAQPVGCAAAFPAAGILRCVCCRGNASLGPLAQPPALVDVHVCGAIPLRMLLLLQLMPLLLPLLLLRIRLCWAHLQEVPAPNRHCTGITCHPHDSAGSTADRLNPTCMPGKRSRNLLGHLGTGSPAEGSPLCRQNACQLLLITHTHAMRAGSCRMRRRTAEQRPGRASRLRRRPPARRPAAGPGAARPARGRRPRARPRLHAAAPAAPPAARPGRPPPSGCGCPPPHSPAEGRHVSLQFSCAHSALLISPGSCLPLCILRACSKKNPAFLLPRPYPARHDAC